MQYCFLVGGLPPAAAVPLQIATDCNENIRRAENELRLFAISKRFPNEDVVSESITASHYEKSQVIIPVITLHSILRTLSRPRNISRDVRCDYFLYPN